ncbi:MAG: AtpZ/AtpI family protein [Gemmatimonas sp.]
MRTFDIAQPQAQAEAAARAQAQAEAAVEQAARAQDVANAARQAQSDALGERIQTQVQSAIDQAMRGDGMTAAEKAHLRDEIRAAIDAAREAAGQHSGPPVTFEGMPAPGWEPKIPPEVPRMMSIMGITLVACVIGFPIARAIGRWIDRRSATPPAPSREVTDRLAAIEQAVESVAVEVERISEGQRFTTRVLSERTHEAAPDFVASRDALPVNARRS